MSFSVVIYQALTSELSRVEQIQRLRIDRRIIPPNFNSDDIPFYYIDPALIEETKNRIKLMLFIINAVILSASTAGGYFLAGKTLKPIGDMVDEQRRFVSDASHELRTPLTSIKTEVEVALRDKKLGLTEAKSLLKSNLEEVDKMQKLSNYLLSLNRYQDENVKLPFETLDLKTVAEEAANKLTLQAKSRKIIIKKDLKSVFIRGNKDTLIELTTILLDNAIKYSNPSSEIVLKTRHERMHAIIEVQDNGIGIKEGEIPYIFNRFYRADSSRSKGKVDGYGLGLSIAKNIVNLNKGKISVRSTAGKGSTFSALFSASSQK